MSRDIEELKRNTVFPVFWFEVGEEQVKIIKMGLTQHGSFWQTRASIHPFISYHCFSCTAGVYPSCPRVKQDRPLISPQIITGPQPFVFTQRKIFSNFCRMWMSVGESQSHREASYRESCREWNCEATMLINAALPCCAYIISSHVHWRKKTKHNRLTKDMPLKCQMSTTKPTVCWSVEKGQQRRTKSSTLLYSSFKHNCCSSVNFRYNELNFFGGEMGVVSPARSSLQKRSLKHVYETH